MEGPVAHGSVRGWWQRRGAAGSGWRHQRRRPGHVWRRRCEATVSGARSAWRAQLPQLVASAVRGPSKPRRVAPAAARATSGGGAGHGRAGPRQAALAVHGAHSTHSWHHRRRGRSARPAASMVAAKAGREAFFSVFGPSFSHSPGLKVFLVPVGITRTKGRDL
jgi:hypothetical protein